MIVGFERDHVTPLTKHVRSSVPVAVFELGPLLIDKLDVDGSTN